MDHYHVWADLRPGANDLDFVDAVDAMLGHMQEAGSIAAYQIARRKLGFGPPELGEFHIDIQVRDLAQLDTAFGAVAPRSGKMEKLHGAVWSKVTGFRSALYRDFPDPVRSG